MIKLLIYLISSHLNLPQMKYCNLSQQKLSLWLVLTLFSISFGSRAQKTFTVDECIEYAFVHNPLMHVATKDSSIAELERMRAKGLYLPRIDFVSAFQYYFTKRQLLVEGGSSLAPPSLPEGEPLAIKTGYHNSFTGCL